MTPPRLSAEQRQQLAVEAVQRWQEGGASAADIPDVAMQAGGMFAAVLAPDAAALERNIAMLQEQVERYARAMWAQKTRRGCS